MGPGRGAVVVLGVTLAIAACQAPPPSATPSAVASAVPSVTTLPTPTPATASAAASPSTAGATAAPSPSPSPDPATTVVVDASLLDHLPASVGGATLTADPATAATIGADPTLGLAASGIAVALAVGSGGSADDIAITSVVQLRPGIFSDAFFADWRRSYDTAACAQAGGASGSSDRQIAGRRVFIGSCGSGAFTYHVVLPGDILVSVTSAGPGDLGALVMAGLR